MLARPEIWYYSIPGVTGTGPLNLHFIRDIGCAYLVAAAGLCGWLLVPGRAGQQRFRVALSLPCTLSFICGTPSLDGSPHDSFW